MSVEDDDSVISEEEGSEGGRPMTRTQAVEGETSAGEPAPDAGNTPAKSALPKVGILRRHATRLLEFAESGSDSDDKSVYDKLTLVVLSCFSDTLSLDQSQLALDEANKSKTKKRALFDAILKEVSPVMLTRLSSLTWTCSYA